MREFVSNGIIKTVSSNVKTKDNGVSMFVKCTVEHLDGDVAGKIFFANRSIRNKDGEDRETVEVGQKVKLFNTVKDGKIFTEVSTGVTVDSLESLLAMLGEEVPTEESMD
jgi:hypothetical protein